MVDTVSTDDINDFRVALEGLMERRAANVEEIQRIDDLLRELRAQLPRLRVRKKANGKPTKKPTQPRKSHSSPAPSVPVTEGPAHSREQGS